VSIVRIGLGENKKFAAGYDAIFGAKKATTAKPKTAKPKTAKPKTAKPKTKTAKKPPTKK